MLLQHGLLIALSFPFSHMKCLSFHHFTAYMFSPSVETFFASYFTKRSLRQWLKQKLCYFLINFHERVIHKITAWDKIHWKQIVIKHEILGKEYTIMEWKAHWGWCCRSFMSRFKTKKNVYILTWLICFVHSECNRFFVACVEYLLSCDNLEVMEYND